MSTRFEAIEAVDTSAGVADAYALVLLNASGYLDITLFGGELGGLAGLSANGLVARTGAGVYAARTLTAPAAGITITNPAGVAGNPTLALANDLAALEALATTGIPCRTAADTWAARTLTAPAAGITITNPAGVAGNPTLVLANDLAAVEGLATTGIARRTASNTWTASNNVTLAEMASMTASKLLGRATASGAGVPQEIGLSTGLAWSGLNIITSDVPLNALSFMANNTIVGNVSGISAVPVALTAAQVSTMIGAATLAANTFTGNQTAPDFILSSDRRKKHAVTTYDTTEALALIGALRPVAFNWIDGDGRRDFGFIAQEVQPVLPAAVSVMEEGSDMLGVSYAKLTAILVAAMQAQQEQIEHLELRVAALGG